MDFLPASRGRPLLMVFTLLCSCLTVARSAGRTYTLSPAERYTLPPAGWDEVLPLFLVVVVDAIVVGAVDVFSCLCMLMLLCRPLLVSPYLCL